MGGSRTYRDYDDAQKRGGRDVWSCGAEGRCRPCGRIHDFGYAVNHGDRRWVAQFSCWHRHQLGCPREQPEPKHDWPARGTRCRRCGARRPRLSSAMLHLLGAAARAGSDGARVSGKWTSQTARALEARGLAKFAENAAGIWPSLLFATDAGRAALKLWGLA